ncbi:MAG: arylsulfatase A-like enzyme [Planctomycetota bacterium]|jgi:arylsulfatase A-like enzyme
MRGLDLLGRIACLLCALFVVLGSSCSEPEETSARNLLWITVDTLRSDRLGCYGYERDTTPAIDALAKRGVLFERAYATAPWTTPSITSMLTGRMPSSHGLFRTGRQLPLGMESLPRNLFDAGFHTWAIVSNSLIGKWNGFDQHFERFDEAYASGVNTVSTGDVIERSMNWLEELEALGERFLLYVHLYDPHVEYVRHSEIGYAAERGGVLTGEESFRVLRKNVERLGEEERKFLNDLYDEEVRFTDDGIALLLAKLDELKLTDTTLVGLTADHGEEILDRGWIGHTRTLYEELIRVPLVLAGPGVLVGESITEPVSLVELPEAFKALLGFSKGSDFGRLASHSIGKPVDGDLPPVVIEVDFVDQRNPEREAHMSAIIAGSMKLIRNEATGDLKLFNLHLDPLELKNLAKRRADKTALLESKLDAALRKFRTNPWPLNERKLEEDELEVLEALGYVGEETD